MDRFMPRRRRTAFLLAWMLCLTLFPATVGQARPPMISDEPAGDPGDGVLRPADVNSYYPTPTVQGESSATAGTAASTLVLRTSSATYILMPCLTPAGHPWPLTFRLIRVDQAEAGTWTASFAGRWHRAP